MAEITHASTMYVPVSDQGAALAFYVDVLGFETRVDFEYGDGERWIEVVPHGAQTSIALTKSTEETPPGVETRLAWTVDDVDAAHAEFKEKGVDVDDAILRKGDPVKRWGGALLAGTPPMFVLRDPDGNSFLIG